MTPSSSARELRGTDLRYVLTRTLQLLGPSTVAGLVEELRRSGFTVAGRPSKTISDALRWERRRDRVRRRDRGLPGAGYVPRSTEHRIIRRVSALRDEAATHRLSLRGGQQGGP